MSQKSVTIKEWKCWPDFAEKVSFSLFLYYYFTEITISYFEFVGSYESNKAIKAVRAYGLDVTRLSEKQEQQKIEIAKKMSVGRPIMK